MAAIDNLIDRFEKGIKIISKAMQDEFIAQGHSTSGSTIKSFEERVRKDFKGLVGEILVASHAIFVDKGTKPHRPPFGAIFKWTKDVAPGLSDKERRSFAFAVINKIEAEGTPTSGSYSFSSNGRRTEFSSIGADAAQKDFEEALDYLMFLIELGDEALKPKAA